MKIKYTILALILLASTVRGQSPEKMSYQAVIRDAKNNLVINTNVGMQISILQSAADGTAVYTETATETTNDNGLVSIEIGTGTTSNDFSTIDWSAGPYFIKTKIDPQGGTNYTIEGISQLLSVPYALYSKTAQNVVEEKQDLSSVVAKFNWANGQLKNVSDPTENQDAATKAYVTLGLSATGDTLYLGRKQFVIIPGISAANVSSPVVVTDSATNVSVTSATLEGTISGNGWAEVTERGFIYSTTPDFPDNTGTKVIDETSGAGYFSYDLTGLESNVEYFYKAYATNKIGTDFGEEKSFTTSNVLMLMSGSNAFMTGIDEVLGKGYDITKRYAASEEIKEAVLDYSALMDAGMIHQNNNINESHFNTTSGKTTTEYQEDISNSVNVSASYGGFSGEMGYRFNSQKLTSEDYAFATRTSQILKAAYYIDKRTDPSSLIPYVSKDFLADLVAKTSAQIFEIYGTDVMLGGKWGAKLDYNMSALKKANSSGSEISAYVEARYKSFLSGGSTDAHVDDQFSSSFQSDRTDIITNAYGGDSQFAQFVHNSNDYDKWINSINNTNLVFMDYYEYGLKPITDFISDPVLKQKIIDARELYLKDKQIIVINSDKEITTNQSFVSTGFTRLFSGGDKDVNSKSGRNTKVEFTITISVKDDVNLNAHIFLKVTEVASNNTCLQGETDYTIPVNSEIKSININPVSYSYNSTIGGSQHDFVSVGTSCSWLKGVSVRIDSNASDDTKYVGIQGTFNIPITIRQ